MILNDTQSGWVWTVPDGALVPSSQDWGIGLEQQQKKDDTVEEIAQVVDPQAPVAESDQFGVRAGALVTLPTLLNDHDANDDVLTIVPESLSGLPAEFGTLSVTDNAQSLAVQVADGASGTATFSYAVTDGTRQDGLNSTPATVTLTVHGDAENSAPVWCGVEGCLQDWPSPEVAPGGTVSVPVLPGWVDPDGDPLFVSSVVNQTGVGSVTSTPTGTLVFRHPDPSLQEALTVTILVTVSDVFGATSEKVLPISVTPTPQLTATPFAVQSAVGEQLTIDPAEHLSGASGAYRIGSATTPSAADATVGVSSGSSTIDFTATVPGNYRVDYTVSDAVSEVVSFVRIQVLADEATALSSAPVTVFVRPRADTSVDVFTAISNPANRVLLLSEALPEPAPGASLDVDVVGQSQLRVRGNTADEQPGKLGVVGYTVSDGTGNPLYTVSGIATIYLLAAPVAQAPIAVADTVVVRAGSQIDIPILDNDVAPDGNVLVLNPQSVQNESGEGLAFASGSTLRYLAPQTAGQYELRYTISVAGSPDLVDSTTVAVTVLPAGENRAPRPHTLTARVLSGESVRVPFDAFGVDPDGDAVALDRVLTQPASGTATLSATGDAILYSSVKGFKGAVDFAYRVRDSSGETGTALVRIGVLDRQSDPSPITFSDYVEVQAGADNQVIVHPAANDIDPAGGMLTLTGVRPDAAPSSAEFDAVATHIGRVTTKQVTLLAGEEPGTTTFVYEVTNEQGDIALGLIVMRVVRASVADFPIVQDTRLTLEERSTFPSGIDVVTGKVSWASGDVSGLKLALWKDAKGATASGWKISGPVPDAGLLVPFSLTGKNFQGDDVTTYGFVRIPAKNEIILALKQGNVTQKVKEDASVTFDMADLVSIPAREALELGNTDLRASGQRAEATCRIESGTTVTYTAGKGAPWTDSCTVPVRVAGQEDFTQLPVPIIIEPLEPEPELRAASLTQSPGAPPLRYDLGQMVTWPGKPNLSTLRYAIDYSGDQFTVTVDGSTLTVKAIDTATPGRDNTVTVKLTSHPNAVPAALSLKVGPAPSELPKGGTVARECSQAAGSSCVIDVIGAAGEVNLFPGTPLTVTSVSAASTCAGVSFSVAGSSQVKATWSVDAAGGKCQTSFVVSDAQGRASAGDRNGSVTLDLQGFPGTPSSVTQTAFDDGSLTLAVSPGAAASAYPALQGFTLLREGREVGSCDASGRCEPLTGQKNGAQNTFEARARNAVGTSLGAVNVVAWSYGVPGMGQASWKEAFDSRTTATTGAVDLSIPNTDPATRAYLVNGTEVAVSAAGSGTTVSNLTLPVGTQTLTIIPVSSFARPAGTGPTDKTETISVNASGSPSITPGSGSLTVTTTSITVPAPAPNANSTTRPTSMRFVAFRDGGAPTCSVDASGGNVMISGGKQSDTSTISDLVKNENYTVKVCYSNGFGLAEAVLGSDVPWAAPDAPVNYTYSITDGTTNGSFTLVQPFSGPAAPSRFTTKFVTSNEGWGEAPVITVQYCLILRPARCGPESSVVAADPGRPYQVEVTSVALTSCVPGESLGFTVDGRGTGAAVTTVASAEYLVPAPTVPDPNAQAWVAATAPFDQVPPNATKVRQVSWTVALGGTMTYSGSTPSEIECHQ
nr:Ig-like domain-containing protein [Leifsonia psychrotolerans]